MKNTNYIEKTMFAACKCCQFRVANDTNYKDNSIINKNCLLCVKFWKLNKNLEHYIVDFDTVNNIL